MSIYVAVSVPSRVAEIVTSTTGINVVTTGDHDGVAPIVI